MSIRSLSSSFLNSFSYLCIMDSEELNKALPPPVTNVNELIGLDFKRNKYGLSLWTDQITYFGYRSKLIDRTTRTIELFVIGTISKQWYYIDEIVILNKQLHWVEEIQLQNKELHNAMKRGNDKLNESN